MADVKVSGLAELTETAAADLFLVTDDSEATVEKSKYVKQSTLRTDFLARGEMIRSKFVYKDSDQIYVGAGWYDVNGKVATWSSELTSQLSGASASTWHYLYLDYSAITSLTAITATELIWSTTSPSYVHTRRGWYNGSDRCIFAVLTNSSSHIRGFQHCGNFVGFADAINTWAYSILNASWTDWTLNIPVFSTCANITFYPYPDGSYQLFYWRTNGQTGTIGRVLGQSSDSFATTSDHQVLTDSSGIIEVKADVAARYVTGWTNGFYFDVGI